MKSIIIIFLTILFCKAHVNGQSLLEKTITFNISTSTIIEESIKSENTRIRPGIGIEFIGSRLFSQGFSIREVWYKSKEYDIVMVNGSYISGYEQREFNASFRYGFGKYFTLVNDVFFINLGLGIIGEYQKKSIEPLISSSVLIHDTNQSLFLEFMPRILFLTKSKRSLCISTPINLFELTRKIQKVENPSIPENHQSHYRNVTDWFPELLEIKVSYGFRK